MARHSKWSQIKRQKAVVDAKRGKEFGKLVRQIMIATKNGGPNPDHNPSLRDAIERARAANMPKENIDRALQRAAESAAAGSTFIMEAYGPAGVAILIEVMTSNRNRTIAEIRHLLSEYKGSLAESGSVMWQFKREGNNFVSTHTPTLDSEQSQQLTSLLEAIETHDDVIRIFTNV